MVGFTIFPLLRMMVQPLAHLVRNPYITSLDGPTAGTSGEKCPAIFARWPNHWDIRIKIPSAFEDMRLDLILHGREMAVQRGLSVQNERQGREYSGLFGTSGELVSTCLTLKAE